MKLNKAKGERSWKGMRKNKEGNGGLEVDEKRDGGVE